MARLPGSLSIDLDDHWAYLKTAGAADWQEAPSFLPRALERLQDVVERHQIKVTAFAIGVDAERAQTAALLGGLHAAGHELASHSYAHDPAVADLSRAAIAAELERAEHAIEDICGRRPRGYRGPSFSWSLDLLEVLATRGYRYDASTFPTFLGPLARLYLRIFVRRGATGGDDAPALFGGVKEALRPLKPHAWQLQGGDLLEIPNTTFPLLRLPIHGTYLQFLADRSEGLALAYLRAALAMCRATRTPPSFLLHASDFLGADDFDNRSGIPGMGRSGVRKTAFVERVVGEFARRFDMMPMAELAEHCLQRDDTGRSKV